MRPFGEFSPDVSDLNTDTLDVARNVYPGVNSYLPAKGLVSFSLEALPDICRGLWYVQKRFGIYDTYAATPTHLYRYNANTQLFDGVSRVSGGAYNLSAEDYWSGVQFGERLIVCQLGDPPQFIDINTPGAHFAQLPNAPIARFVAVADDKVVFSAIQGNAARIQWSDINDSEEYTLGLAGNQEFPDAGEVVGFFPHARLVLQQMGMRAIVPTGDIYSFNFPELTSQKGSPAPWSAVEYGNLLYWLSDDGFYAGNSEQQKNIAEKRVAGFFLEQLNHPRIGQVYAAFDPFQSRIYWAYSTGDTDYNDRIMVYDYALDRWSELEVDTYVLARFATAGISLEGGADPMNLDLPGLPSLDSPAYKGGAPIVIAVGTDKRFSTFEGLTLPVTLETGTYNFGGAKRVRMRNILSFFEGLEAENVTLKIRKRQRYGDDWRTTSSIPQQLSGFHRSNADGMFHRVEFSIPAGTVWSHAHGWEPNFIPTSER